jgi:transposase
MLLDTVRGDPVCRRLNDRPRVGAHVGLTPKRYQSGEIDYDGGVSKCGDALLRTMLYEAAHSLLTHSGKWSSLKAWGMRVAQRRGIRRAIVAVARRLVASTAGKRIAPPSPQLPEPAVENTGTLQASR